MRVKRLRDGVPLPRAMTAHAAGSDLAAAIDREITLAPHERTLVPTGLAIALPEGYEAQVRPRSGLAAKLGIGLLNAPGTIDADYRGEILVLVVNLGTEPATIRPGDRIAQLVVAPVLAVDWQAVDDLDDTERGSGGFGHTG